MELTKYPQSCLKVTVRQASLLIDPGRFVLDHYSIDAFGSLDAVLYTHRHTDHFDPRLLPELAARRIAVITNADVAPLVDGPEVTVLGDKESTAVAGVEVRALDLPHCLMVDGSAGPPNSGFVIDDRLLHPGDGTGADVDVEVLAVPIAGPDISFADAYRFVAQTQAEIVIPIHYDAFVARPEQFAGACGIADVRALKDGNTTAV